MENRVQTVRSYTKMKSEPAEYWVSLIDKYFVGKKSVTVSLLDVYVFMISHWKVLGSINLCMCLSCSDFFPGHKKN